MLINTPFFMKQNLPHHGQSLAVLYHEQIKKKLDEVLDEIFLLHKRATAFILDKRRLFKEDLKQIRSSHLDEYEDLDDWLPHCLFNHTQGVKKALSSLKEDCLQRLSTTKLSKNKVVKRVSSPIIIAPNSDDQIDEEHDQPRKQGSIIEDIKNIQIPQANMLNGLVQESEVVIKIKSASRILKESIFQGTPKTLMFEDKTINGISSVEGPFQDCLADIEELLKNFDMSIVCSQNKRRATDSFFINNRPNKELLAIEEVVEEGKGSRPKIKGNERKSHIPIMNHSMPNIVKEEKLKGERINEKKRAGLVRKSLWNSDEYERDFQILKRNKMTEEQKVTENAALSNNNLNARLSMFTFGLKNNLNQETDQEMMSKTLSEKLREVCLSRRDPVFGTPIQSNPFLNKRESTSSTGQINGLKESIQSSGISQELEGLSLHSAKAGSPFQYCPGQWGYDLKEVQEQFEWQKKHINEEDVFPRQILSINLQDVFETLAMNVNRGSSANWTNTSSC